jgi:hypothetical protein
MAGRSGSIGTGESRFLASLRMRDRSAAANAKAEAEAKAIQGSFTASRMMAMKERRGSYASARVTATAQVNCSGDRGLIRYVGQDDDEEQ